MVTKSLQPQSQESSYIQYTCSSQQWAQFHQSEIMQAIQNEILPKDILEKILDVSKKEQEIIEMER